MKSHLEDDDSTTLSTAVPGLDELNVRRATSTDEFPTFRVAFDD